MKLLQNLRRDKKGFTLIEVVIVLAIAALILVIVFLAVGGAQRSQRDQASKDAAGKVLAGYSNALTDGTAIPTAACTIGTNASGAGSCSFQAYFKGVKDGRGNLINWASSTVPTSGGSTVANKGVKCSTPNGGFTPLAGDNNVAVMYWGESAGKAICIDNQ